MKNLQFIWIGMHRADIDGHNSRNIEMITELRRQGLDITMITSYKQNKPMIEGFVYLSVIQLKGFFKIHFMFKTLKLIFQKLRKQTIIFVVMQEELYLAVFIKYLLKLFKNNVARIHLDIRSQPVAIKGFHYFLKKVFFWKIPLIIAKHYVDSFSFITEGIKEMTTINPVNYCIWQSGVNIDRFNFSENVKRSESFELLYLGSVSHNRGVKEVLTAISYGYKSLKKINFRFRIVGNGNELEPLKEYVAILEISDLIIFQGYVDYENVPKLLREASFFICPLPNHPWWNDSSPIKVYEYLSTGKPFIITNIPAHSEIINKSIPGVISIDSLSPSCLLRAIFLMKENYRYYLQYSKTRREYAKANSWEKRALTLIEYWSDIYRNLTSKGLYE